MHIPAEEEREDGREEERKGEEKGRRRKKRERRCATFFSFLCNVHWLPAYLKWLTLECSVL